ncbi:efflux RND transporter periplasmic adaptor subunit [Novosphingobium album (ex Liu et al. 2023)]|uniref:Efflux RND transporter periplasmic adaptor subunit n=1 Tax=Novosphingobium album (ex Liu et al. 2023) TaxID=3031130 RepID=A0ABT5WQQ8_9SPHN|nr:efflux RND transporter periplasmic adaptor subunit [Novosphingobium album (ex Liu et al. 2023)]MDE8652353.1 efflux RND transporter periplasmic adaptor subunit [Novosphingobium album (ex Liu et al. 2023)]
MNLPFVPEEGATYGEAAQARPARDRRLRRIGIAAVAIAAIAGLGWKLVDHPDTAVAAMPPAMVQAAHPLVREVTQWDDYVGRFAPSQSVEVRPRVSGAITAIHFRDGDYVQKGQPLFTVDPRPYAAALAEARADVASAQSALALARADYARVAGLTGDEAIAAGEVDALRAKVRSASAALAAAQARVRSRALDVEFATVRAPISGRVSDRRVDAGNLVSGEGGANATLLTTINAVDPIYFSFDASEALFLKAQRDRAENRAPADVEVRLQDEADYRWKGRLDFTDNGLDPRSGTIRIRASFANPQRFLTPGMFGNMRLASGGKIKALLVPDAAIQSDQTRKIVLVVGKDGAVAAKPVEIGPLVDGLRVVRSGLSPSDTVVISNFGSAIAGAKVAVKPATIRPQPGARPAAAPSEPMAAQATLED